MNASPSPPDILAKKLSQAKLPTDHTAALVSYYRSCDEKVVSHCNDNAVNLACSQGCSHCCYQRVTVAPHEVFAIADYVERRFSPEERSGLTSRLQSHLILVRNMSDDEQDRKRIVCPLLVNGRCSVYPVRPIVCRGYHSLCSSSCQRYFAAGSKQNKPPKSDSLIDLWEDMGFFGDHSYRLTGYDMTEHDLPLAIHSALTDPVHHRRWRQKKNALLEGKIRSDPFYDD